MKNILKNSYGCWPRGLLIKTRFETIKYGCSNTRKKLTKSFTRQGKWWPSLSCEWHQYSQVYVFSLQRPIRPSHITAMYSGGLPSAEGGISFPSPMCLFPPALEKPPALHFDAAHIPRQYPRHRNRFPPQPGMWVSSPGSHSGPSLSKGVQQKFTE